MKIDRGLNALASVLLAKAIKDLYPQAILGESTINDDGFTYSFATSTPISVKELPKILKQMHKNIDRNYTLHYETIDQAKAHQIFSKEKYKLEIIQNLKQINVVKFNDDFVDLCEKTDFNKLTSIKAIELLGVSGVY
jgi:threonyl-tRNA synthetase